MFGFQRCNLSLCLVARRKLLRTSFNKLDGYDSLLTDFDPNLLVLKHKHELKLLTLVLPQFPLVLVVTIKEYATRKFDDFDFQVDDRLDVRDSHGTWCQGKIVKILPEHIRIHYCGWTSDFDENIHIIDYSFRLRPFLSKSLKNAVTN